MQNNLAIRYCLLHEDIEQVKWLLNYDSTIDLTENDHAIFKEFVEYNKINTVNIMIQLVPNVYEIRIKDDEIYAYKITNGILPINYNQMLKLDDEICCVCFTNNINVKTECEHSFCYSCLNLHYNNIKNCPLCRTPIKYCISK